MTTPKQQRRGSPRPGNGGQRAGAGRPVQRHTLSTAAARQLHHLARMQRRPPLAVLEELISVAAALADRTLDNG